MSSSRGSGKAGGSEQRGGLTSGDGSCGADKEGEHILVGLHLTVSGRWEGEAGSVGFVLTVLRSRLCRGTG